MIKKERGTKMAYNNIKNLVIEDAKIIFRNFSGKESTYNRAGDRNFCAIIDDEEMAKNLIDDGWNIHQFKEREDGETPDHYIQVAVNFNNIPPSINLVKSSGTMTSIDESSIRELDYAEIKSVDLIIRPYSWEVNGKTGVKAYLKTMYVTIEEDQFASKYTQDDDIHVF